MPVMQVTDYRRVKQARRARRRKWLAGAAIVLAFVVKECRHTVLWDNFGTVEAGAIYRSGQLKPYQFADAIERYGIRTVINTREPEAPAKVVEAERRACEAAGAEMVRIPMPGDGRGTYDQYDFGLSLLRAPGRRPVLVHCARGTHRTGALVGSYRVLDQGWDREAALREMASYRFDAEDHPLAPHLETYWDLRESDQ